MNRFFYLTQYDCAGMFDRDIVATLERNHKKVNKDEMAELLELLPGVSDKYNQVIYNLMMEGNINNDNIDEFIKIWAELEKGNISNALELLDIDYYDILQCNDWGFFSYDELEEMADDDLKTNGINASCLYWLDDLDYTKIHVFNGYANGFYKYDDIDDLLGDVFDDYIKDLFIETLGDL